MRLTNTGKIRGKKICKIGDNELKRKLNDVLINMIGRCYDPNNNRYYAYGERGIKICEEWISEGGLDRFYEWALNNGYEEGLTIDRINFNEDYSPQNCRWATRLEQANNKRNNIIITFNGETDTLPNHCRKQGLDYHAVFLRIYRRHWPIERALTEPLRSSRRS